MAEDTWSLPNRLRGRYPIGPRLSNGEPEFGWREFPPAELGGDVLPERPTIFGEAADRIEALEKALKAARSYIRNLDPPHISRAELDAQAEALERIDGALAHSSRGWPDTC